MKTLTGSLVATLSLLSLLGSAALSQEKAEDVAEARTHKSADGGTLPYRLIKPADWKKESQQTWPLMVFLHGAGERGSDNKAQLKWAVPDFLKAERRKDYACFIVAPQCPKDQSWAGLTRKPGGGTKQAEQPSAPGRMVLEIIAELRKEFPHIDPSRIYLTGLSMGGYGTWDLISRQPDLFAAAVPICGGGDVDTVGGFAAKVPIWCFHGDKDTAVKVENSRTLIEALKKAGAMPKYTEYPGVGHNSWSAAYADPELYKWLFEQKRAAKP